MRRSRSTRICSAFRDVGNRARDHTSRAAQSRSRSLMYRPCARRIPQQSHCTLPSQGWKRFLIAQKNWVACHMTRFTTHRVETLSFGLGVNARSTLRIRGAIRFVSLKKEPCTRDRTRSHRCEYRHFTRWKEMIFGSHVVVYSKDAEADRAFLSDVLGLRSVDAGHGWLIFALPPAETAVHPAEESGRHELYFLCNDLSAEIAALAKKNVACSEVHEARWGSITKMRLPGGGEIGLYQPKHTLAPGLQRD